jgi:hypothetical protein
MKKFLKILALIFLCQNVTAQEEYKQTTKNYTFTMDSLFTNLNKGKMSPL